MTDGMISAPQPEAVEAGIEVLKAGGNLIDATVCAAIRFPPALRTSILLKSITLDL